MRKLGWLCRKGIVFYRSVGLGIDLDLGGKIGGGMRWIGFWRGLGIG